MKKQLFCNFSEILEMPNRVRLTTILDGEINLVNLSPQRLPRRPSIPEPARDR